MASKNDEACAAVARRQASDAVFAGTIDGNQDTLPATVIKRVQHRLGISAEVAALVVELAGLGPREARR